MESLEYFVNTVPKAIEAEKRWASRDPSLHRKATVAGAFDSLHVTKFYSLSMLGMLLRSLIRRESEHSSKAALRASLGDVEIMVEDVLGLLEEDRRYVVIDIDKMVKIRLAAGIYTALYKQLNGSG